MVIVEQLKLNYKLLHQIEDSEETDSFYTLSSTADRFFFTRFCASVCVRNPFFTPFVVPWFLRWIWSWTKIWSFCFSLIAVDLGVEGQKVIDLGWKVIWTNISGTWSPRTRPMKRFRDGGAFAGWSRIGNGGFDLLLISLNDLRPMLLDAPIRFLTDPDSCLPFLTYTWTCSSLLTWWTWLIKWMFWSYSIRIISPFSLLLYLQFHVLSNLNKRFHHNYSLPIVSQPVKIYASGCRKYRKLVKVFIVFFFFELIE